MIGDALHHTAHTAVEIGQELQRGGASVDAVVATSWLTGLMAGMTLALADPATARAVKDWATANIAGFDVTAALDPDWIAGWKKAVDGDLCGFPSSVSDQTCILPPGHPADSAVRFHRFRKPKVALCGYTDKNGGPCIELAGHAGGHADEDFGQPHLHESNRL